MVPAHGSLDGSRCVPASSNLNRLAALVGWVINTTLLSSGREDKPLISAIEELLWWFELSDLGFPALLEGEYRHSIPQARCREQIGLALDQLTLARKQPSQDRRRHSGRGFTILAMNLVWKWCRGE